MCEEIVKNQMAIVTIKPTAQHIGYVVGVARMDPEPTPIGDQIARLVLDDDGVAALEKLIAEYKIIKHIKENS